MVNFWLNSVINSSIFRVAIGSSASRAPLPQTLLLTTRERKPALIQLVFHLVPQCGTAQCLLDLGSFIAFVTIEPQSESDVVEDAGREGIRLLEDHADKSTHRDGVDAVTVDITAAITYVSFEAKSADQIIH